MTTERRQLITPLHLSFFLLGAALLLVPGPVGLSQADQAAVGTGVATSGTASKEPAPPSRTAPERHAAGVVRKGNLVVISKEFANEVRENNTILLSKVAIKARLNKNGGLRGYEAVQIDKESVVEGMGFKPHDLVISVNAIPARDIEASRESLESADRFEVTLLRKGKTIRLRFEIR